MHDAGQLAQSVGRPAGTNVIDVDAVVIDVDADPPESSHRQFAKEWRETHQEEQAALARRQRQVAAQDRVADRVAAMVVEQAQRELEHELQPLERMVAQSAPPPLAAQVAAPPAGNIMHMLSASLVLLRGPFVLRPPNDVATNPVHAFVRHVTSSKSS